MSVPIWSDHELCAGLGEPRNGVEQGDNLSFGRVLGARRLGRKAGAALVEAVDLCKQLGAYETLMRL